jgi:hypothetical protein
MLHPLGQARVADAGGNAFGETHLPVDLRQQQQAAVGREIAAREVEFYRLAGKQRKREGRARISHRRVFPFWAFGLSLNRAYTRQAKHPSSFARRRTARCGRFMQLV